ncbi:MAG: hypothetical protein ABI579_05465 [Candidatus Sumerlaeota bacterium]
MDFGNGPEYVLILMLGFTPNLVGMALIYFVHIFNPGPQGKLRAERDHFFAGYSLEQVREHMQKRLQADNFKLLKTGNMHTLQAERSVPRPKQSVMTDYPFKATKLMVDVRFQPHSKGLGARLAVQCKDFQVADVGESDYLQAMLDFISLKPSVRSVPPTMNSKAYVSLMNGIVGIFLPLLLIDTHAKMIEISMTAGIMMGAVTTFIMGIWGIGEILVCGNKYKGIPLALAGMFLAVSTIGITSYTIFFTA